MINNSQTAVITGSTGGIGHELSMRLAQQGWNLILLNRSSEKSQRQIQKLKAVFPNGEYFAYHADFTNIHSIKSAISAIAENHKQINALFNVAGFITNSLQLGAHGIESQFAINTVAPYVLLKGLRSNLAAGARASKGPKSIIVNFTSSMINSVKKLDVNNLISPQKIAAMGRTYSTTKLAINVVNQSLKDELNQDGILILAVDPGPTKTPMTTNMEGVPWIFRVLTSLMTKDVKKQTEKLLSGVFNARDKDQTGTFISEGNVKREHKIALDSAKQAELSDLLDRVINKAA